MKKLRATILAGAVLAGLLISSPAEALDRCITGQWYNPSIPYEGITVQVLGTNTVISWFTNSFFDKAEQNWILFEGPAEKLIAYDTKTIFPEEGVIGEPVNLISEVGTGRLYQVDNNHVEFFYDIVVNLDGHPTEGGVPWCLSKACTGFIEYQRLTQPIPCTGG